MKITEFEKTDPVLPNISESGVVIYVRETGTDYLRIAIDVDEFVTSDQLREAIPLALAWRDKLIQAQGHTGLGSDFGVLWLIDKDIRSQKYFELWTQKGYVRTGLTYRHVVNAINQTIAEWLFEYARKPMPANIKKSPYKDDLIRHLDGIETRIPDPIERVRKILRTMRFKDQEVQETIDSGLEIIQMGNYPSRYDYPVSRDKLISVLKWWRK